jgi:hypothetical protein
VRAPILFDVTSDEDTASQSQGQMPSSANSHSRTIDTPIAPPSLSPSPVPLTRMSALAAINDDKQRALLEKEAVALEGNKKFTESLDKYEELLALQKVALGDGHAAMMETMNSILRVIEAIKDSGSGVSSKALSGHSKFLL